MRAFPILTSNLQSVFIFQVWCISIPELVTPVQLYARIRTMSVFHTSIKTLMAVLSLISLFVFTINIKIK